MRNILRAVRNHFLTGDSASYDVILKLCKEGHDFLHDYFSSTYQVFVLDLKCVYEKWVIASEEIPVQGNFVENMNFHPAALNSQSSNQLNQIYGDVWEWTMSPYTPYPGYKSLPGALGEYNGKFMSSQMVLRGGSCATSVTHIRNTYRNFFPPHSRWQFMGIRLASDI